MTKKIDTTLLNESITIFNDTLTTFKTALNTVKNKIDILNDIVKTALYVYLEFNNKTCLITLVKDSKTFNPYFKGYFNDIGLMLVYDDVNESLKIFKDDDFKNDVEDIKTYKKYANDYKNKLKNKKESTLKESLKNKESDEFKNLLKTRLKNLLKDIPDESLKDFKDAIKKELK